MAYIHKDQEFGQNEPEHLLDDGYEARTGEPVDRGEDNIGDKSQHGHWVIKVVGPELRHQVPIQVDFQVEVSQTLSRTTDPRAIYALAIPMKDDLRRVLKTNKGFGLSGLKFFVVYDGGEVDEYDPPAISQFVEIH